MVRELIWSLLPWTLQISISLADYSHKTRTAIRQKTDAVIVQPISLGLED